MARWSCGAGALVGGDDGAAAGLAGDEVTVTQGRSDRGDDTPGGLHGFGVRGAGDLGGCDGDEFSGGGGETRGEPAGGGEVDLGVVVGLTGQRERRLAED